MYDKYGEHKNKNIVRLTILFFIILYGFSINGVDMRYPIIVVTFIYFLIKNKFVISIPYKYMLFLVVITGYSMFISLINATGDYFETLRFCRCIITFALICLIIKTYKIKVTDIFYILKILLLLNSIAIFACIIWPKLTYVLLPISRMTKAFMPLRSTGLTNGEDAAGFLVVCGIIIEIYDREKKGKSPMSVVLLIFLVSTVFTSRFTMVMASVVLIVEIIRLIKRNETQKAIPLIWIMVPIVILATVFLILTTGFAMELREVLLSISPRMNRLYNSLVSSYLDYGIYYSAISRNITITNMDFVHIIFGEGIKASVVQDSGYVKTIYSIGLIGLVAEIIFHLKLLRDSVSIKRKNPSLFETSQALIMLIFIILAWELKYSFMFANTVFEIIICIYMVMLSYKKQNE